MIKYEDRKAKTIVTDRGHAIQTSAYTRGDAYVQVYEAPRDVWADYQDVREDPSRAALAKVRVSVNAAGQVRVSVDTRPGADVTILADAECDVRIVSPDDDLDPVADPVIGD